VAAKRRDEGTPPMKVHSSPVPAHAIQVRKSRRSISSSPFTTSLPVKIFLAATVSGYRADRGSAMALSFARDFHFEVPRCLSEESPAPHSRKDHITKSVQNQTLINTCELRHKSVTDIPGLLSGHTCHYSCRIMLRSELWTSNLPFNLPVYSIRPSFRNLFIK